MSSTKISTTFGRVSAGAAITFKPDSETIAKQSVRSRNVAAGLPACRSQRVAVGRQGRLPLHQGRSSPATSDALYGNITGPGSLRRLRPNPERGIMAGTVTPQTTLAIAADGSTS